MSPQLYSITYFTEEVGLKEIPQKTYLFPYSSPAFSGFSYKSLDSHLERACLFSKVLKVDLIYICPSCAPFSRLKIYVSVSGFSVYKSVSTYKATRVRLAIYEGISLYWSPLFIYLFFNIFIGV